jgi:hypothetical protein
MKSAIHLRHFSGGVGTECTSSASVHHQGAGSGCLKPFLVPHIYLFIELLDTSSQLRHSGRHLLVPDTSSGPQLRLYLAPTGFLVSRILEKHHVGHC